MSSEKASGRLRWNEQLGERLQARLRKRFPRRSWRPKVARRFFEGIAASKETERS